MSRRRVSSDFGFPRWGGYGRDSDAVHVRMCDFAGCTEAGKHPAPKSPGSRDRWHFCEGHAAEYNRNWNFFAGMSEEAAQEFRKAEADLGGAFRQSSTYAWGGVADDDGMTRAERDAFTALELESTATASEIKAQFRRLAKRYHPDTSGNDPTAARRFQEVRAAYDVLRVKLTERV